MSQQTCALVECLRLSVYGLRSTIWGARKSGFANSRNLRFEISGCPRSNWSSREAREKQAEKLEQKTWDDRTSANWHNQERRGAGLPLCLAHDRLGSLHTPCILPCVSPSSLSDEATHQPSESSRRIASEKVI